MQSHVSRPARSSLVMALGLVTILACRESATSVGDTRRTGAGPRFAQARGTSAKARDRLHARNKEEWVGIAHNKAIDAFRHELRKPGVLTSDVCTFVLEFSVSTDRSDAHKRVSENARWHSARSVQDDSRLCSRSRGNSGFKGIAAPLPTEPLAPRARQSTAVEVLVDDIETAVAQSANSYELATELNTILDRADSLTASDQVIVASTVSVAQNSFEYWETQYDFFVREVIDEFGPCAADQSSAGVPAETLRDHCIGGQGGGGNVVLGPRNNGRGPRVVGSRIALECPPDLAKGFRNVVKGDIQGAFKGAMTGLFAGSLEGAAAGALTGAAIGSLWAAVENAWEALRCIYHF